MIATIAGEFVKLHTVRSPWLVLGVAQLLVIAGPSGLVMQGADLTDPGAQSLAVSHVGLAAMFTLVFGILAVAGEYRHRTIADTYLTTPGRGRVIGAKLITYVAVAAVSGIISATLAVVTSAIWWGVKGEYFDLADAEMWQTLIGGVVACALYASVGVGIGALIRNLAGALVTALAWLTVVEGIVGQLIGTDLAKWLPFTAGRALGLAGSASADLLERGAAGFVVAGYALVFAVIAMFTTLKRDVI